MIALGYSAEKILTVKLVLCVVLAKRPRRFLTECSLRYQHPGQHVNFTFTSTE